MGIKSLLGSLVVLATACSSSADSVSTTTQAATGINGVYQNGLTTNGVYQNGVYQNGVYQNGVYQNGVYQNGVYQNGVYQNGVYQNGVYQNGVYQNGAYTNGVYQNGVYQNGVYQNGVYQNGVYQNGAWLRGLWSNSVWQVGTNAEALRTNAYTRQFFQYVYACAMPGSFDPSIGLPTDSGAPLAPGRYSTSLDPNNGTLACNAAGGCDDPFYTCSPTTNTCVVQLQGAVGVGVNSDGTSWWNTGRCDESCQRWVSACVLARTNAYGVHVEISMRAPDDAPQTIKNALAVGATERTDYPLREGAYYGNVFATTPVNPSTDPSYSGDPGQLVATPQFYACAGPGSNIPNITKRFCSSQGDQSVIRVPGVCLPAGQESPTCAGEDTTGGSPTFGAIHDCYTSTDWTGLTAFKEVITVYLKQPTSLCGNSVCEAGEEDSASPAFCPSDCHTGSWARSISDDTPYGDYPKVTTLDGDGSTLVAGIEPASDHITVDDTSDPPVILDPVASASGTLALAKYAPDGALQWANHYGAPLDISGGDSTFAATVAPDHSIVVALVGGNPQSLYLARYAADGSFISTTTVATYADLYIQFTFLSLVSDAAGDIYVLGTMQGSTSFGSTTLPDQDNEYSVFAAKFGSMGQLLWVKVVDSAPSGLVMAPSAALDANGDLFVSSWFGSSNINGDLFKLRGSDGTVLWTRSQVSSSDPGLPSLLWSVAPDPNDATAVYVTGSGRTAKLDGLDGHTVWLTDGRVNYVGSQATFVISYANATDPSGNVVVLETLRGAADFGAGVFNSYGANHFVVSAYAPDDGHVVWAKHLPTINGNFPTTTSIPQIAFDARGYIHISNQFAGSMLLDDRLIVSPIPETTRLNTFVGTFAEPSPIDHTPPLLGDAYDQTGIHFSTIPAPITVEATSAAGASVFFMVPTAIDAGGSGASVSCSPAPLSVFPINTTTNPTTTVTCTATDPLGNHSSGSFPVTVRDISAPTLNNLPADFASDTAVVTYPLPTAVDQVDGSRPVTCVPASGSTFHSGPTTVTCATSDSRGNTVQASFNVMVAAQPDTTPPVITVPGPQTLEATGSTGAVATFTASATDDVDVTDAVTCTPASGAMFPIATTSVSCTSHDAAGNAAAASFNVTVSDTTPPTLTVPANIAVEATSGTGNAVTFATSATDLVDGARPVTCSPASGATFALGMTTVNCTTSDAHNNTRTATFTVTVGDTTPPTVTVPANISVAATSAAGATVSYASSATDAIDGSVATTCTPASGSTFAIGTTTVTCLAHDASNNTASKSFTVTVTDSTPPVITVPANISVAATSASGAAVTYASSATDAIDGSVATTCTPPSGSTFAIGTTTVTCSAHDTHNNTASKSFTVTVADTTPPVVTVPANISVAATSASGAAVTYASSATDAIDGSVPTTCTPASGSTFAIGTTTVICSARDAHNNTASKSFTVTVADTTAPVITVPANLTVPATSPSGAIVTYSASAIDAIDGSVATTCSKASGSTFAIGTTTVTCSAHDAHNNTASKSFTVTVTNTDTTPPVITVPANMTVAATGSSGAIVTYSATAVDAVDGNVATTCSKVSGSTFAIGTTTVTCSAHDSHNNTASKSFTVTVADTTAPVITVPANISAAATTASGAPVTFTSSATDAVDGNVATTCSKASGSAFVLGTTTVTCSAHDAHNNTASKSFTVTVQMAMAALLAPINADNSSEFLLNSIVPVRFSLSGASANLTTASATVTLTKTSSTISGTHHKLPRYFLPTSGSTAKYNPLTHHYYFRYDTSGLTAGTYTVKVDFHDGAVHTAQVSLGSFGCPSCENDGGDD